MEALILATTALNKVATALDVAGDLVGVVLVGELPVTLSGAVVAEIGASIALYLPNLSH